MEVMKNPKFYKNKFMIALVEDDDVALIRYLADNVKELAKQIKHGYDSIQSTFSHGHTHMVVAGEKLKIEFIPIIKKEETNEQLNKEDEKRAL